MYSIKITQPGYSVGYIAALINALVLRGISFRVENNLFTSQFTRVHIENLTREMADDYMNIVRIACDAIGIDKSAVKYVGE